MDHVVVRDSRIGKGLFAARAFRPKQIILRIEGRIVPADVVFDRGGRFADNCYRFGPETYLDPGNSVGRYVNHSCDPNVGVRKRNNRLYLFAAKPIRAGAELTFDYSTILGDDDIWVMRCKCNARACRKRIRRFGALPEHVLDRYLDLDLIPKYILATWGNVPD